MLCMGDQEKSQTENTEKEVCKENTSGSSYTIIYKIPEPNIIINGWWKNEMLGLIVGHPKAK